MGVIKKADVYMKGESDELRLTIKLSGDIENNFKQIHHAINFWGHDGVKLESIYFREDVLTCIE